MTIQDATIAKLQQLPEPLSQEVSDFIDFLLLRQDSTRWQLWTYFNEIIRLSESDFADYLTGLETYENRLARGDVKW